MMKKQYNNKHENHPAGPTCGNCMHSNSCGYHCGIFTKWQILPDDPANDCEQHFPRVEKRFLRYYKHKPVFTKGWPDTDLEKYWEYLKDLRHGIITDNNGGYFKRWPFGSKINL